MNIANWMLLSGCMAAVAAAVAGVTALIVASLRRQQRRRDQLIQWAQRHGWRYTPSPAVDWTRRLPGANPHGVSMVLSAEVGRYPVSVGEYSYTETHTSATPDGMGGSTTTTTAHSHHFIVATVWLPRSYPAVAVHPRGNVSKVVRSVFGDGATAIGDDRFDRQFRIVTAGPGQARHVIGPALAAAHVAGAVPPWSVYGHELLTYWPGQLADPARIPTLAAMLTRVADLIGR